MPTTISKTSATTTAPRLTPTSTATVATRWYRDDPLLLRIRCDRGQISGVTLVYAAIAVVNTLIMAIRERTRDLAQLRLAGATPSRRCARCHGRPRWSRRWACLLGLAVTGITAVALSEALHQTGSAAPPTLPWTAVGSVVVTTVALALVTSVAAGIAAVRMRPMDGIGIQD